MNNLKCPKCKSKKIILSFAGDTTKELSRCGVICKSCNYAFMVPTSILFRSEKNVY